MDSQQDSTQQIQQERSTKQKKEAMKEIVWPYELTMEVNKSAKPKICFLSGEERKYYPENPGHSKLGVMDTMAIKHKGDSPDPSYYPLPMGVTKPISRKSYGIFGLSSDRFPKNIGKNEVRPDPGTHQILHMYTPRPSLSDTTNPLLLQQCTVAFGSHLTVPRFGVEGSFKPPGPGSYQWENCGKCSKVKSQESFGGHRCILPTVTTICKYGEGEKCHECGNEQRYDYYRTRARMFYPNTKKIGQPGYIVICRRCFCKATNGHYPEWTKKLLTLFSKARHCSNKHDHQGLPEILTKAFPAELAKLRRKEVILSKYFADFCPPEIN